MVSVMEWINERQAEKKTTLTTSGGGVTPVTVTKVAYICNPARAGWVNFILDNPALMVNSKGETETPAMCTSTKLTLSGVNDTNDRVRFKIENGQWQGEMASMVIKGGADSSLTDSPPPIDGKAQITVKYGAKRDALSVTRNAWFTQQFATLQVGSISVQVTLNTNHENQNKSPIPEGIYDIEFPDFPHDQRYTRMYKVNNESVQGHGIWFPIHALKNEHRYLHLGNVSDGCVTVYDYGEYTKIHDFLLKHKGVINSDKKQIIATLVVTK